jgi:ParB/RepB/Spo0J family partition protein
MKADLISIDAVVVPDVVQRDMMRVKDDLLRKAIEAGGIQQPLVVVADGARYLLIKGLRRLRAARALNIRKVPVIIDDVPEGMEILEHVRLIRAILDQHRQALLPTQRAQLIKQLKGPPWNMTHPQIALYRGVSSDSVTNWLSVDGYIEPVKAALDSGALSMRAARSFIGLSEKGQKAIWKAHGKELQESAGGSLHASLRERYSPEEHPEFYRAPDVIRERLKRPGGQRRAKARPVLSDAEKRKLLSLVSFAEAETREAQADIDVMKREINASIAPARVILRSERLRTLAGENTLAELERFAEAYP